MYLRIFPEFLLVCTGAHSADARLTPLSDAPLD
jgi:hypothetical protein